MDAPAIGGQRAERADVDLRASSGLVAPLRRGLDSPARLRRDRRGTRALRRRDGLYARRADAGLRASVLWVVGLPDDRLFRSDVALRYAARLHALRRPSSSKRYRRHIGLGAFALSQRSPRPGAIRRQPSLRACRPSSGLPSRMEELDLQLRPTRGP